MVLVSVIRAGTVEHWRASALLGLCAATDNSHSRLITTLNLAPPSPLTALLHHTHHTVVIAPTLGVARDFICRSPS